jgi:hypothetical protein
MFDFSAHLDLPQFLALLPYLVLFAAWLRR